MNPDLRNILSVSNKEIDNQKLMEYISGNLSPKETHEVEILMADSEFVNDAVEGLQQVDNKTSIGVLVEQLNRDLQKKLEQKKSRKEKKKLKDYSWIYFTIALILILITIAWFILYNLRKS